MLKTCYWIAPYSNFCPYTVGSILNRDGFLFLSEKLPIVPPPVIKIDDHTIVERDRNEGKTQETVSR